MNAGHLLKGFRNQYLNYRGIANKWGTGKREKITMVVWANWEKREFMNRLNGKLEENDN